MLLSVNMTSVLFLDDSILCHSIISIKQKATLGYYKHFTHHHSNKNLVPTFSNLGGVGVGGGLCNEQKKYQISSEGEVRLEVVQC